MLESPSEQIPQHPSQNILLKTILYTLSFLFFLLLVTVLVAGLLVFRHWRIFQTTAQVNAADLISEVEAGWNKPFSVQDTTKTLLILGLDSLETRGDVPPLTDVMIIAKIHTDTGKIAMLSLPRDLWNEPYQTKINALYAYGQERDPNNPAAFPTQVIDEMFEIPIDYTVTISLDQLEEVIDTLGGIDVEVPEGFIDEQFPRTDVDVTKVTDPALLYQVVQFDTGLQFMNGEKALQYIRSRKAAGEQGTDTSRNARQLAVIEAMVNRLYTKTILMDPVIQGKLFLFYQQNFASQIPLADIVATAKRIYPVRNQFTLTQLQLPIYPEDKNGILENPPLWKTKNIWIYQIRDQELLQTFITENL